MCVFVYTSWVSILVGSEVPLVPDHWAPASLCQRALGRSELVLVLLSTSTRQVRGEDGKTQTLSSISLTIVFPIFSGECENILNTASSTSIVCLAIASNPLGLLLEGSQGKEATEKGPLAT